jgi:hypothetical protein
MEPRKRSHLPGKLAKAAQIRQQLHGIQEDVRGLFNEDQ